MTPEVRRQLASAVRAARARVLDDPSAEPAARELAFTLLHRLVVLRMPAATGTSSDLGDPRVYRRACEALARDLPGLFGPGPADSPPPELLRYADDLLGSPALASCWTDDMTPGWVYQFFNDPDREALDAKLHAGGKLDPAELASKTQVFSEPYMVEWLLQNALGPIWLAICAHHGWTAELAGGWCYAIPQPPAAPGLTSIRQLRLLDPAVGAGHFLVAAFDLLFALYREEARQRGGADSEDWSDRAIVEHIVEHNLHGVDIDPRAVRIAAVAVWLKARRTCPAARPRQIALVAASSSVPAVPDPIADILHPAAELGSLLRIDLPPEQRHHLETYLAAHTPTDELGVRLERPLAAGVRLLNSLREGSHDLVVGNPPYQDTADVLGLRSLAADYPEADADLFSAFMLRALQLVRPGGAIALVTKSDWLYLHRFRGLRRRMLAGSHIVAVASLGVGAFEQLKGEVVRATMFAARRRPAARDDEITAYLEVDDAAGPAAKAAALRDRSPVARELAGYRRIDGAPLVLGWDEAFVGWYAALPKLGDIGDVRQGLATGDNLRFLRRPFELDPADLHLERATAPATPPRAAWVPYIKGAEGHEWFEPAAFVVRWDARGLQIKLLERDGKPASRVQNEDYYFRPGVAFASTGSRFSARIHRYRSIFDVKGQSVYARELERICCVMNSARGRALLAALNPSISFQVGDAKRLPLLEISGAPDLIVRDILEPAFGEHEARREASCEFRGPGPSPWRHAQAWAQRAVDRPASEPLPTYTPEYDPEPATDHLSHALGQALGRFTAPEYTDILLLDGTLAPDDRRDGLGHPAARPLHDAWAAHGPAIARGDLRGYLRRSFCAVHRRMYDNRPIHWPLSSAQRTFVAWICIHRWRPDTLQILLTDHLRPTLARLGEHPARDELTAFIALVERCAARGPPNDRELDAAYALDRGDGVMINSAALWPLLAPQWHDPRRWWSELAAGERDWSGVAMRYWPRRVLDRCRHDASLAAAHRRLWGDHPARAWAWELRLQAELGPAFHIDEPDHELHRANYLAANADEARAIAEREARRSRRP